MEDSNSLKTATGVKTGYKKIPRSTRRKKVFFVSLASVIFLVVLIVAVYSTYQLYKMKDPAYQQKNAERVAQQIVSNVAKLIELPPGTPQVITVDNAETIRNTQPFFEKAVNGDQVLVYPDQAILYRPSLNKIMNIGTVNKAPTRTTRVLENKDSSVDASVEK